MYSYFLNNLFIHFGSNSDKSFACLKYSLSISHIVLGFCGFFLVLCIVLSSIQLSESHQLAEEGEEEEESRKHCRVSALKPLRWIPSQLVREVVNRAFL